MACVCDRGGNKTSFKTTLGLAWVPSTSGQQISKKTNQKGEAIFQSNVLRCTSKADKDVKIKVSSTEHRGLQVRENVLSGKFQGDRDVISLLSYTCHPRIDLLNPHVNIRPIRKIPQTICLLDLTRIIEKHR